MSVETIDVNYVANLARLSLTPEEQAELGGQLGEVLGYVEKLKELNVEGIEPMAHAVPLINVTRADEVRPSLDHALAMQNAPAEADRLFRVPKIVE